MSEQKEPYKLEPHNFKRMVAGKLTCIHCGIMRMSHPFSQWIQEKGCDWENHPQYKSIRKSLSGNR